MYKDILPIVNVPTVGDLLDTERFLLILLFFGL